MNSLIRRSQRLVFLFLLVFLMLLFSFALADTPVQVRVDLDYRYDLTRPMLDLINDFRTGDEAWAWNQGDTEKEYYTDLEPLEYDYGLERIAMQRAAECAVHYDHTRPNGKSCFTIYPSSGGCGENIAAGYRTTESVFLGWREDDYKYSGQGHRRNMLSSYLRYVGIGCVYADGTYFWCQVFCSKSTGEAASSETGPAIVEATAEMLRADGMDNLSADPDQVRIPEGETAGLPVVSGRSGAWGRTHITILNPPWVPLDSDIISAEGGILTAAAPGITTLTVDLGETLTLDAVSVCQEHTWDDGTVTKKATCTAKGVMHYVCEVCGETKDEAIKKIPHTEVDDPAVPPTCEETGLTQGSHCSACGKVFVAQEVVDALGHDWQDPVYTWEDDDSGVTAERVCARDENHVETETVETTRQVTEQPTCVTEGEAVYRAVFENSAFAEQKKTVVVPAMGHSLKKHEQEDATCTESGVEAYWECLECDWLFSDPDGTDWIAEPVIIPARGHELSEYERIDATCTDDGTEAYWECDVCGCLFSDPDGTDEIGEPEVIPALGHEMTGYDRIDATCTDDGIEAYWECGVCGCLFSDAEGTDEIEEPEIIPATGHEMIGYDRIDATCTDDGMEAYWECGACGGFFSDAEGENEIGEPEIIPALGHALKKRDRVEAADFTEGKEAYWECTRCHLLFSDAKGTKQIDKPATIPMKNKIAAFVARCYQLILGRNYDPHGLETWYINLNSGQKAAAEIIDSFVRSNEFKGKNHTSSESVEILYNTMLGRGSDPGGKAGWVAKLDAGQPLAAVINGFCGSNEFKAICESYGIRPGSVDVPEEVPTTPDEKIKAFVKRCYRIILGRGADETGLNNWFRYLKTKQKAASEIIDGFVNSPEFLGKHYSSEESVEILYKAMLGRGSDPKGKANWVAKLNAGQPFAVVINGFCGSQEFRGLCESYGIIPGSVKVKALSGQTEEELSYLALNAEEPITKRSEANSNRVEIINPSDTIDLQIGTAVQAVYINEEKAKEYVSRCHEFILGRAATEKELDKWVAQLTNGTKTADQIARGFLFSDEFKGKNTSNEALVRILYKVYLNREADPAGLAGWTAKLDSGMGLKDLLDTLVKTDEYRNVINGMGK